MPARSHPWPGAAVACLLKRIRGQERLWRPGLSRSTPPRSCGTVTRCLRASSRTLLVSANSSVSAGEVPRLRFHTALVARGRIGKSGRSYLRPVSWFLDQTEIKRYVSDSSAVSSRPGRRLT